MAESAKKLHKVSDEDGGGLARAAGKAPSESCKACVCCSHVQSWGDSCSTAFMSLKNRSDFARIRLRTFSQLHSRQRRIPMPDRRSRARRRRGSIRDMLRNYIECNMVWLAALAEALGVVHASSHRRKRSVPPRLWNLLETSAAVHVSLQVSWAALHLSIQCRTRTVKSRRKRSHCRAAVGWSIRCARRSGKPSERRPHNSQETSVNRVFDRLSLVSKEFLAVSDVANAHWNATCKKKPSAFTHSGLKRCSEQDQRGSLRHCNYFSKVLSTATVSSWEWCRTCALHLQPDVKQHRPLHWESSKTLRLGRGQRRK